MRYSTNTATAQGRQSLGGIIRPPYPLSPPLRWGVVEGQASQRPALRIEKEGRKKRALPKIFTTCLP